MTMSHTLAGSLLDLADLIRRLGGTHRCVESVRLCNSCHSPAAAPRLLQTSAMVDLLTSVQAAQPFESVNIRARQPVQVVGVDRGMLRAVPQNGRQRWIAGIGAVIPTGICHERLQSHGLRRRHFLASLQFIELLSAVLPAIGELIDSFLLKAVFVLTAVGSEKVRCTHRCTEPW